MLPVAYHARFNRSPEDREQLRAALQGGAARRAPRLTLTDEEITERNHQSSQWAREIILNREFEEAMHQAKLLTAF